MTNLFPEHTTYIFLSVKKVLSVSPYFDHTLLTIPTAYSSHSSENFAEETWPRDWQCPLSPILQKLRERSSLAT